MVVAHHGPQAAEIEEEIPALQLVDALIQRAASDEAARTKLLRWMRRTPPGLGRASAGRPSHGAQIFAVRELEKLLATYGGLTEPGPDLKPVMRPRPFLAAARAFFEAVDGKSPDVQKIWAKARTLASS